MILVGALGLSAAAGTTKARDLPHVTVFGDSVGTALLWGPALDVLSQGIDVDMEVISCRRTEQESCFEPDGVTRPPTVMDMVGQLGTGLGQTVVMLTGYDDYEDSFPSDISDVMAAMEAVGVKHVIWLNLRAVHHPYVDMNADLAAAAALDPVLTVVDWNSYSRDHDDWFQADGLHPFEDGAIAMATLIHSTLVTMNIATDPVTTTTTTTAAPASPEAGPTPIGIVTSVLPSGIDGQPYKAQLAARGGRPPYRWKRTGKWPQGIELAADGLVAGIPRGGAGSYVFGLRVTDLAGSTVTRRVRLRVAL